MADATPPLTSADMLAMLRRHYVPDNRPPGGVFAPEIGSPCGSRRADLIWLSTTTAGGRYMIGHEVKVSRSDVMVELRDPTKAEPWSQFCNQWYLVVSDPALVAGLDVPEAWGIMAPPSGRRTRSMTVVRKAPTLAPSAAGDGVARVTAWLNQRYMELQYEAESQKRSHKYATERLERELELLRSGAPRSLSPHARRIQELSMRVEKELRGRQVWSHPKDEDIVAALVDLAIVRNAARQLSDSADSIRRSVEGITRALDSLPEVNVEPPSFGEAI